MTKLVEKTQLFSQQVKNISGIAANILKRRVGIIYAAHATRHTADSVVSVNYLLN